MGINGRVNNINIKVGLFGIGLQTYWEQFDGLEERLTGYISVVEENLKSFGAEIVNEGLVDTPEKAFESGRRFKERDVDIIFLYVTTYALSSTVLPVVRKAKVPVVILNLVPEAAIDYSKFNKMANRRAMTGEWLAFCSACPVPEIANVFNRANIPFFQITGMLHNDPYVWKEVEEWIAAARVAYVMYNNRLGVMGNYYGGMLDIYTDFTLQCAVFGGHIEVIEVDELSAIRETVNQAQINEKLIEFNNYFDIQHDCTRHELERAAQTAVALDILVKEHNLGSLAYYHKGTGNVQNENTMTSVILGNSLLTGRHTPVAGEYEVKNAQAMKIMDSFNAGGSFTEYYAMDYNDDVVLMGHDGPCHPTIAEGKIKVKPLQVYHGKVGNGLSVEMSVKYGEVTLLSVVETSEGSLMFLVAEGESVAGPILEIGNTNSRYRFSIGARGFVESWNSQGPAHHCAIGKGHIAAKIIKLGKLLNTETVQIC
ncbi:arabinose isomerase [Mucilaginibacter limnophilus]|uniref:Arabinose isomerase n=1 Tax=Mucilaginibacter limnophilus TaxID=1932778 RepID=A0A3S3TEJ7_9SPHI|nr:arabinose isomerase [Mucilaginibacter limnophilus]RVT97346.1 arabinose isomerase [Mucilaginibacter limnophilus]